MLAIPSQLAASVVFVFALRSPPSQEGASTAAHHMFASIPAGLEVVGDVEFAPDGSMVAYRGKKGDKLVPVVSDKLGEPFDTVDPPLFPAAEAQPVFRVSDRPSKKVEKWRLIQNGATIAESEWIGPPAWSPDGARVAYWTNPGAKLNAKGERTGGALVFVVDGKKGPKWNDCSASAPPVWSDDSKHVATIARKNEEWCVLLDGEVVGSTPTLASPAPPAAPAARPAAMTTPPSIHDVALSRDAAHVAYVATVEIELVANGSRATSRRTRVVYDKAQLRGEYEDAGLPTFSPDGERFAYVVVDANRRQGVVLDFKEPKFESGEIGEPLFSPDGKRLAYVVSKGRDLVSSGNLSRASVRARTGGKHTVVLDGTADERSWDEIRHPTFSPDSTQLAYLARKGETWFVVLGPRTFGGGGKRGALHFSADSTKLSYGAHDKSLLAWFEIDAK
jgi:hypothetical protein